MSWYKQCKSEPEEVALEGVLRQSKDGFVYLDINYNVPEAFRSMIPVDDLKDPASASDKYVGAHISVMHSDEIGKKKIEELGDKFEFFVKGVETVKPDGWEEVNRVYFITVDSPDLEKLREKYDLPAKYKDHNFHITVAVATNEKEASSTNWYKKASTEYTVKSQDGRQQGYEDTLGDVQRYIYDPYIVRVFITKLADKKVTVSINLMHNWSGMMAWQDFWKYDITDGAEAVRTYKKVTKAAADVFESFRTNEIPNNLLYSHLREAVRYIDLSHKPTSRIPHVDWAREQKGTADWRSSIYGTRYPDTIDGF